LGVQMLSRRIGVTLLLMLSISIMAAAQDGRLEVGGGFAYLSGNFGLTGFTAQASYHFTGPVYLVGGGDFLWDNSRVGVFDLSPTTGAVRIKSNSQQFLGGARVQIIGWKETKGLEKRKLIPFGEILLGYSRLSQTVIDSTGTISLNASDNAFTWVLGGGVDYRLSSKWRARGTLDLERTHFVDAGQSHARVTAGIFYRF